MANTFQRGDTAAVVPVSGGYAVRLDHVDRPSEFVGVDGFWARTAEAVMAFKSEAVAQAQAQDLSDPRANSRWS